MQRIYIILLICVVSLIGSLKTIESYRREPRKGEPRKDYWHSREHRRQSEMDMEISRHIKSVDKRLKIVEDEFNSYKDIIERYILKGYVISDMKPSINERMQMIEKKLSI